MKSRIIISVIALVLLSSACSGAIKVTNNEFQNFKPFKATLIRMEEIPTNKDSAPSAMRLRDYRVTLRKMDGTVIIVERVSSILGNNKNWPGTIPVPMLGPTIEVGKSYDFPADLYRAHPVGSE